MKTCDIPPAEVPRRCALAQSMKAIQSSFATYLNQEILRRGRERIAIFEWAIQASLKLKKMV